MTAVVLTHGGAGAPASWSDGCLAAAQAAQQSLASGASASDAAVSAVVVLEDDPRFNAGTGCVLREDGRTVEADAGLMSSEGRIGAVGALRRVKNPILAARKVLETRHILLVGEGALSFARAHGLETGNSPMPGSDAPCDTVGAVVRDSSGRFAAASSTGGIPGAMLGRIGDSPLPGGGYWAGPHGAVTATGLGEEIARRLLCREVYGWIEGGLSCEQACRRGVALFSEDIPIGILAVGVQDHGWAANRDMACGMR